MIVVFLNGFFALKFLRYLGFEKILLFELLFCILLSVLSKFSIFFKTFLFLFNKHILYSGKIKFLSPIKLNSILFFFKINLFL